MAAGHTQITITLTAAQVKYLRARAKKELTTVSALIRRAVAKTYRVREPDADTTVAEDLVEVA